MGLRALNFDNVITTFRNKSKFPETLPLPLVANGDTSCRESYGSSRNFIFLEQLQIFVVQLML
jgi:hypothetical protein